MISEQLMQRFGELVTIGNQLATRGRVDDFSQAFNRWRISSLSLLEAAFPAKGLYYTEFAGRCKIARTVEAKAGTGILQAAKDDIESGFQSSARSVDVQDLALHPRIAAI